MSYAALVLASLVRLSAIGYIGDSRCVRLVGCWLLVRPTKLATNKNNITMTCNMESGYALSSISGVLFFATPTHFLFVGNKFRVSRRFRIPTFSRMRKMFSQRVVDSNRKANARSDCYCENSKFFFPSLRVTVLIKSRFISTTLEIYHLTITIIA